ncbi:bile acid:sodium symporter family protein [Sphingobacteriales bacterium UPWRP_1]|nr:bile acid:sodium symporter family protein [Sphingobacteriales bacterium UPWRP_1]
MLGMGLNLTYSDFKQVFKPPKALIIGLLAQMVLLPAIAFLIAGLLSMPPEIKAGLVLIAACPGGASSNLVNHLLRGNVALSISLTALNSMLTLFTIPFVVNLGMYAFLGQERNFELPVLETMRSIFFLIVLPAFAGVYLRGKFNRLAHQLEQPLRFILPAVLFTAFLGVLIFDRQENGTSLSSLVHRLPLAILLNILGMAAGYLLCLSAKLKKPVRITIAVEVGLQNSSLAIFIATTLLNSSQMAVIAVLYGITSFFITIFVGWLIYRFVEK